MGFKERIKGEIETDRLMSLSSFQSLEAIVEKALSPMHKVLVWGERRKGKEVEQRSHFSWESIIILDRQGIVKSLIASVGQYLITFVYVNVFTNTFQKV